MAVLCTPLSTAELLKTERNYNVRIMRRLDYDTHNSTYDKFREICSRFPYKLMFIFSNSDAIVVNTAEDEQQVSTRLGY